ncbi:radical SAM protein [bacterium]|nr:radical SAM protein [bacterium]
MKNYRIFLGNVPWRKEGYYGVRAGSRWPHFETCDEEYMPFPFFLAYATALLEENGFECLLLDGIAENIPEDEFISRAKDFKPDLVLLEVSTISIDIDLFYAQKLKDISDGTSKIALSGLHTDMFKSNFLKQHSFIDFILQGEYELTLLELARNLSTGGDLNKIMGLILRGCDGNIIINPRRPVIEDLDSLPWPARHHLKLDRYNDRPGAIPKISAQVWASRGCPFNCVFCAWPQIMYGNNKYRVRNPIDVLDEVEYLVKELNVKSIYFDDDTFNIGKSRILKICDEFIKRKLDIPWAIMARADTADEEMLIAMKKAGLYALKYGVESASQTILDNTEKRLDIEKVKKIIKITKELDINVHLTFCLGLPGENKETLNKTIDLACELSPDSLQFSIVTPFPGSKYFNILDSKGMIVSKNWSDYDGYSKAVIKTEHLSAKELEDGLKEAYRRWDQHLVDRIEEAKKLNNRFKRMVRHPIKTPIGFIKRRITGEYKKKPKTWEEKHNFDHK